MQGKGFPLNIYIVFLSEFFNTPGNEVTPGSDIVGEDGQIFLFVAHEGLLYWLECSRFTPKRLRVNIVIFNTMASEPGFPSQKWICWQS